jgi:GH24 family phage-related lysozyme (muramidase)
MHDSVKAAWFEHSRQFEGRVPGMYCDILGLITCAQGNLIDPINLAEGLPWVLADGSAAPIAQVRTDWHTLKDSTAYFSKRHWKYAIAATKCRLTDAAMDALVMAKLLDNEAFLRKTFTKWDELPADAQLGIFSMAWACGPGFTKKFPNFTRLALSGDWSAAIAKDASGGYAAKIREAGNPGVVPRNAANRLCFANAALVLQQGLPVTRLYWPNAAPVSAAPPSAAAPAVALADAPEAKADWQRALDHFVAVERERFLAEGPSGARDLRDWEEPHEAHEAGEPESNQA